MKYWRIILGFAVFLLVVWIVVGEQLAGASADAVVNAEVTTARAPIAGRISMPDQAIGSAVDEGETLFTIVDDRADGVRFDDLTMELGYAEQRIVKARAVLEALKVHRATLEERLKSYNTRRIAELEERLKHAKARLELLSGGAEYDSVTSTLDRGQSGNPGDPLLPGIALEYARERVATLEIELAAARDGVYLGDGYNDAPFSGQRLSDIDLRIREAEAELAEVIARRDDLDNRLGDEGLRLNRLARMTLRSQVNGSVWEHLAFDGEYVQRGQDVLRLIDCDSTMVTLSVTEPIFNALSKGDKATFRLSGTDIVLDGSVIRLAGAGAEGIYTNLAVAPSEKHLERYDVTLLVPELRSDPDLRCKIGRTGRAFFSSRPLDSLRSLFD